MPFTVLEVLCSAQAVPERYPFTIDSIDNIFNHRTNLPSFQDVRKVNAAKALGLLRMTHALSCSLAYCSPLDCLQRLKDCD